MARESSAFAGSGVSVLRHVYNVPAMQGTNNVILNYEDVGSMIGIVQTSGLVVGTSAVHLTGPATRLKGRRQVMVHNFGPGNAFIGASTVTTSNGFPINAGSGLNLNVLDYGHLFVVSSSTSNLRILEIK
jgi:hypothetical protein